MRIDRIVIGAVVLLGTGLGLIFGYCNGTVGFNTGYPLSGTSFTSMLQPRDCRY